MEREDQRLFTIHATLAASCSNLWVIACWFLPAYMPSKDRTAEDTITFCVTFGLKPSSSFMASVGKVWCSELLNDVHNDFSQSSRMDAFCTSGKQVSLDNRQLDPSGN